MAHPLPVLSQPCFRPKFKATLGPTVFDNTCMPDLPIPHILVLMLRKRVHTSQHRSVDAQHSAKAHGGRVSAFHRPEKNNLDRGIKKFHAALDMATFMKQAASQPPESRPGLVNLERFLSMISSVGV
eukprot:15438058-Alexandrium_andersonii.AAC.1